MVMKQRSYIMRVNVGATDCTRETLRAPWWGAT
jgi:hypothetical protein